MPMHGEAIAREELLRKALTVGAGTCSGVVERGRQTGAAPPVSPFADTEVSTNISFAAANGHVRILDHLILGSPDSEDGRGYVSVIECLG